MNWHAIRIRPQHRLEFSVMHALNQREHPAIVPAEEKWEKRKGRRVRMSYPVIPCYVFAGFESYRDFWVTKEAINNAAVQIGKRPPIVGLVGYGAKPAKLTAEEVSTLQAMSAPPVTQIALHKALRDGGRASIIARGHPFEGHEVTIDSITRAKCKVLLNLLGSMRVIEIDANALEAA